MALSQNEQHEREAMARKAVFEGDRLNFSDDDIRERIARISQIKADQERQAKEAQALAEKTRQDTLNQQRQLTNTSQEVNTRAGLADQIASTKVGANRRGLLYSGMNQAAQGGLRAGAQAQISQGRANVNAATQDQLAGLQGQDLQNAMTKQQNLIQSNQSDYRTALNKKKRDQETGSSVGSAIGGGLGAIGSALTGGLL